MIIWGEEKAKCTGGAAPVPDVPHLVVIFLENSRLPTLVLLEPDPVLFSE